MKSSNCEVPNGELRSSVDFIQPCEILHSGWLYVWLSIAETDESRVVVENVAGGEMRRRIPPEAKYQRVGEISHQNCVASRELAVPITKFFI